MLLFKNLPRALGVAAVCSLLITGTALAHHFTQGALFIQHPWSRALPKSAKTGAGYMKISNSGDSDDALVSVTSPLSDRIEFHQMSMDHNVMKMRQLKTPLVIPAHADVTLDPSSLHIMFLNIKKPFVAGESFPATLHFQKAGDVDVEFFIEAMGATVPKSHSGTEHADQMQ